MNRLTTKFGATALKRALILGVIGALLMGVMVAQAVSSSNLGAGSIKLATQAFSDDTAVTIAAKGIMVIGATDDQEPPRAKQMLFLSTHLGS